MFKVAFLFQPVIAQINFIQAERWLRWHLLKELFNTLGSHFLAESCMRKSMSVQ